MYYLLPTVSMCMPKKKVRLRNAGRLIEDFDLLIGCAAKAAELTVVTHNVKHFSHIEGIDMEDWVVLT